MGLQAVTDNIQLVYDPLKTVFDVFALGTSINEGGDVTQQYDPITGNYDPDRSQFPMMLTPSLLVTNPNTGEKGVEKAGVSTVTWYREVSGTFSLITSTSTDSPYYLSGKSLVVKANIAPGVIQRLRVDLVYTDPDTGIHRFGKTIQMSTASYVNFKPMLHLNVPNLITANPLIPTTLAQRTVTASFFIGGTDFTTNVNTRYQWQKKDGNSWRAITATDIEVVSIATRQVTVNGASITVQYNTMTLDLACIGNAKYRCLAYHANYPESQFVSKKMFTIDRQRYGERIEMNITRNKLMKPGTGDAYAEVKCLYNSAVINNAGDVYRFKWTFYKYSGSTLQNTINLGWGPSVEVKRADIGTDKTKGLTVGVQPYPLSEYQLLTDDNGNPITDDSGSAGQSTYGGYVVGQVIKA